MIFGYACVFMKTRFGFLMKTIVAESMRSGESAARVSTQGSARFEDGTWYVSVGDAQFHFTQRNRIVVPDNQAASQLKYG